MAGLRIGIVGVGGMGTFHARTLADLPEVDVIAVSDPQRTNAHRIRDELGAVVVDDPAELIAGDIDGVVIASPDETHPTLAVRAIDRAVPTLCEKPLATSAPAARSVIEAETRAGRRFVQLGFMREYDVAHRQVATALRDLGSIDYVRAVHRNANATPRPLAEIVGQSMVHDIHTVRHLSGSEFVSVQASGSGPSGDSYRHIVALTRLDSGAHAMLEFDDGGYAYEVGVEVLAATGDVLTGVPPRAVERSRGTIAEHVGNDWFGRFADAYRVQDRAWVDSIRSGAPTGPTAWDGYAAQVVVDGIIESLRNGAPVVVDPGPPPDLYR